MKTKEAQLSGIRKKMDAIIEELEQQAKNTSQLHDVEKRLFRGMLSLGLMLLGYYINAVKELLRQQGPPLDSLGEKMQNKGSCPLSYFSVFGRLSFERFKYYSRKDKSFYRLDATLGLPKSSYSYLLQDWLSYGAVEVDFEQSSQQLEHILGHSLWGMQASRCAYALSEQVEPYYEHKQYEPQPATHLSVSFDGKGIPIRGQAAAEPAAMRLEKGKKRGVKKEATVSLSSSFTAKPRTAEQLLESLFSPPSTGEKPQKHCWHQNQHLRAFLCNKSEAVSYGLEQVLKLDCSAQKPIIVLMDGDRALEKAVNEAVAQQGLEHRLKAYVLDFIHLLEYVWKVANAELGEKHPQRQGWVKQQAGLLLDSEQQKVLEHWQQLLENNKLSERKKQAIQAAITYLSNHLHMTDYKRYLQEGYPITTGAVESACGHFVKSRMDRNAMHWSQKGAQKMLDIRAVKKNGDWQDYLKHFIEKEQNEMYNTAA